MKQWCPLYVSLYSYGTMLLVKSDNMTCLFTPIKVRYDFDLTTLTAGSESGCPVNFSNLSPSRGPKLCQRSQKSNHFWRFIYLLNSPLMEWIGWSVFHMMVENYQSRSLFGHPGAEIWPLWPKTRLIDKNPSPIQRMNNICSGLSAQFPR